MKIYSCRAARSRATVHPGAENTTKQAGNLPDSEVFSRPEHYGFGRDGRIGNDRRSTCFEFSHPAHPVCLKSGSSGFQSQQGAETMTTFNTTPTPTTGNTSPISNAISRQQAIENALSMALYYVRRSAGQQGIQAATGRAVRAASMLKQACTEPTTSGRA